MNIYKYMLKAFARTPQILRNYLIRPLKYKTPNPKTIKGPHTSLANKLSPFIRRVIINP